MGRERSPSGGVASALQAAIEQGGAVLKKHQLIMGFGLRGFRVRVIKTHHTACALRCVQYWYILYGAIGLRPRYAMSGTELAYGVNRRKGLSRLCTSVCPTQCPVLFWRITYALSGTDSAHGQHTFYAVSGGTDIACGCHSPYAMSCTDIVASYPPTPSFGSAVLVWVCCCAVCGTETGYAAMQLPVLRWVWCYQAMASVDPAVLQQLGGGAGGGGGGGS
eukprot:3771055-Rhodomonas_salina.1